ncbi:MAG TPA: hypothetical protein PLJ39_10910 [Spirochaetota bacterium]|nr:hypothetical protein [Spirochaetota bacterium]
MIKNTVSENILSKEAMYLFKKRRYKEASFIFEKANSISPTLFNSVMSAFCSVMTDNFIIAEGIISSIKRKYPDSPAGSQLENFLFIKGASSVESVLLRLAETREKYPFDKKTKQLLSLVEKTKSFEKLQKKFSIFDAVDIPGHRFNKPRQKSIIKIPIRRHGIKKSMRAPSLRLLVMSVIFLVSAVLIIINFSYLRNVFSDKIISFSFMGESEKATEADISSMMYPLIDKSTKVKPLVSYSSDEEVRKEFNSARNDMKRGNYNNALFSLNRIINSNSNIRIKEKALYLVKYIAGIEDKPSSEISYNEVSKSPELYAGFTVRWKGKVQNFKNKKGKISFSLISDSQSLEIFAPFEEDLSNGQTVEVKGTFVNAIGKDKIMYVQAEEIY